MKGRPGYSCTPHFSLISKAIPEINKYEFFEILTYTHTSTDIYRPLFILNHSFGRHSNIIVSILTWKSWFLKNKSEASVTRKQLYMKNSNAKSSGIHLHVWTSALLRPLVIYYIYVLTMLNKFTKEAFFSFDHILECCIVNMVAKLIKIINKPTLVAARTCSDQWVGHVVFFSNHLVGT